MSTLDEIVEGEFVAADFLSDWKAHLPPTDPELGMTDSVKCLPKPPFDWTILAHDIN